MAFGQSPEALFHSAIDCGFPVSYIEVAQAGNVGELPGPLLVGGHNLARISLADHKVGIELALERVRLSSACVTAERVFVAGAEDNESGFLAAYNLDASERLWQSDAVASPVTCMANRGKQLVVGDELGAVTAVNAVDGRLLWSSQLHSKMVTSIAAIDDQTMVTADWVGKIVVFDATTGAVITDFQQHRERVTAVVCDAQRSPVGMYSASRDGTVRLWYPTQRRLVRFVQLREPVTALADLGDGQVLAATRDARLHRIDMNNAKELGEWPSGLEYIQALAVVGESAIVSDGLGKTVVISLAPAT